MIFSLAVFLEIVFIYLFWLNWPGEAACRVLVPWPGIEPIPFAVKAQSLNHYIAREAPKNCF